MGFQCKFASADEGAFFDSGQRLGNSDSYWPALEDFDKDGDLDAWVANYVARRANKVWLNNGNGTFSDSGQSLGNSASRVAIPGDVDRDGDLDIFVGNGLEQPDRVWLNDGSGGFIDSGQLLGRVATDDLELADLNGDGNLDAFIASASAPGFGNPANLVFFGSLSGVFTDSGQRLGNSLSESVALGDLDGDLDLDAFVANRVPAADRVWLNDGLGTFVDSGQTLSTGNSLGVALGDVDGDGDLDAFIADLAQPNTVWLNNGSGVFTDSGQRLGSSVSHDVKLEDLDDDGDLDAFVTNLNNQPNTVWWNNGSGIFTDSGQRLGSSNSIRVSLADLDDDGDLDAFVANTSLQPNTVWFYNRPPVAQCANVTVSADSSCQASASIDKGSFDPDGAPFSVVEAPTGPYQLGMTNVTLTVTDDKDATDSCSAVVDVVDDTPVTITGLTASPDTLWPPNRKMVPVQVTATTSDNCDLTPSCAITEVTSDEPVSGPGSGNLVPDWEVTGDLTLNLRAERQGSGDGREYTINVACTDDSGNTGTGTVTVNVPQLPPGNK